MSNPKILILGGSGFIGRSLCEQLVQHFGGRARITVPSLQRLVADADVVDLAGGQGCARLDAWTAGR